MKISVVQFDPVFGETERNIEKIKSFIFEDKSELILFPELATSGYFFQSRDESLDYGFELNSPIIDEMQELSKDMNKIICFGFPEIAKDKVYNSAVLLFPDKKFTTVYRKTHLFYKERSCFNEGDTGFFVVDYPDKNIRIGPMICYDWRFPEASRALGLQGADLIVCPSNLVTDVWHLAMPARALENKVYLAVANRSGIENRNGEELQFKGMSAVYHYNGRQLCIAGTDSEEVIKADIEPAKTRDKHFNEFNHLFKDRRPEFYK